MNSMLVDETVELMAHAHTTARLGRVSLWFHPGFLRLEQSHTAWI